MMHGFASRACSGCLADAGKATQAGRRRQGWSGRSTRQVQARVPALTLAIGSTHACRALSCCWGWPWACRGRLRHLCTCTAQRRAGSVSGARAWPRAGPRQPRMRRPLGGRGSWHARHWWWPHMRSKAPLTGRGADSRVGLEVAEAAVRWEGLHLAAAEREERVCTHVGRQASRAGQGKAGMSAAGMPGAAAVAC